MAKKLQPDRILFFVTLALVSLGIAMVFSSSAIVAKEKFGDNKPKQKAAIKKCKKKYR